MIQYNLLSHIKWGIYVWSFMNIKLGYKCHKFEAILAWENTQYTGWYEYNMNDALIPLCHCASISWNLYLTYHAFSFQGMFSDNSHFIDSFKKKVSNGVILNSGDFFSWMSFNRFRPRFVFRVADKKREVFIL